MSTIQIKVLAIQTPKFINNVYSWILVNFWSCYDLENWVGKETAHDPSKSRFIRRFVVFWWIYQFMLIWCSESWCLDMSFDGAVFVQQIWSINVYKCVVLFRPFHDGHFGWKWWNCNFKFILSAQSNNTSIVI